MPNNKDYDYWFNERLRGMGHPELIGQPRKHMDDGIWHDAHDWAARQLRREGFTSAKDRRRAGTDDRAAHDMMDDKSWANQQGLENYLGGGSGGPALSWIDPLGNDENKESKKDSLRSESPEDKGSETSEGDAPSEDEASTDDDRANTEGTDGSDNEGDDGYNLAKDPAARQNYADKNDMMDRAEEAEQADDEEPGIGEDADAKNDLPKFQKEGGPGGPAKPEGAGISKAGELGGNAAKLGEAAEGAAAAETAAAAAATAAAETETVAGIAAFLGSGWGLVVAIVIAIIVFFLTLFMFQTLAAAFPGETKENKNCISTDGHAFPLDKDITNYSDSFGDSRGDHLHSGTDIMHKKDLKAKTYAIANGKIVSANTESNGASLKLHSTTDGDSNYYFYTHFSSITVKEGDKVKAGDLIGYSAGYNTGASGDHIHISVGTTEGFTINLPNGSGAKQGQEKAPSPYESTLNPYPILKAIDDGTNSCLDESTGEASLASGSYADLQAKWKSLKKEGVIQQDAAYVTGDVEDKIVKKSTLTSVITIAEYAKSKNFKIRISVFKTGHRPGTWHEKGYAFDIANEEVAKKLMPWLKKNRKTLKINELIFDNSLIGKSSNYYNLDQGDAHSYDSGTLSGHRNHIHVATY